MAKRKFQPAEPGEKRQKSKRSYNEEEEEEEEKEEKELIKVRSCALLIPNHLMRQKL
jgi:hypothetical protein